MKILVLNGSPKGKNSVTVQTALYLEKRFPDHEFSYLHVGQKIKALSRDFSSAKTMIESADLLVFAYPVYTFLAPYQLHRFVELIKEYTPDLAGKYATQISTSKHFYDVTAHKYIEENIYDFGMKYVGGLSADMDDLITEKGQKQADCYFSKVLFDIKHDIYQYHPMEQKEPLTYEATLPSCVKTGTKDVVLLTNIAEGDETLRNMMEDFKASCIHSVREINLRDFPFSAGCLGCLQCATTATCVHKDGFDNFLRSSIQNAAAIVYAFTVENHYTEASFKCYDDRQFCNGHRTVTHGMPVGYLINGHYNQEENLKMVVNARCEVGGVYLCGVATSDGDTAREIQGLSLSLDYALTRSIEKPTNFYGVGGSKIFRDLVYLMQGMMKADHKYYKATGVYDFPQKKPGKILQMKLIGAMMAVPSVQKKMKSQMNKYIIAPYQKVIENTKPL